MEVDLTKVSGSYVYKGEIKTWFNNNIALSYMFADNVLDIHFDRYIEKNCYDNTETIMPETLLVFVNCSDIFAWGCCDKQELSKKEIKNLFHHWYKNNIWGSAKWCCIQRNQKPQQHVIDEMKSSGCWDDDMENLGS